jgi:hypothetical protein
MERSWESMGVASEAHYSSAYPLFDGGAKPSRFRAILAVNTCIVRDRSDSAIAF